MSDQDLHKHSALERFNRAMGEQTDPVMIVLRAHLYSETILENILAIALPRGDKLNDGASLSYHQKLAVVESLDVLPDSIVSSLRNLNKIRNECSHQLDKEVSLHEITRIGSPLGKKFTELKHRHVSNNTAMLANLVAYVCGNIDGARHKLEEDSASDNGSA